MQEFLELGPKDKIGTQIIKKLRFLMKKTPYPVPLLVQPFH